MSARADFMLDFGYMSLKIYGDLPRTISGDIELFCTLCCDDLDDPVVKRFLFAVCRYKSP